MIASDLVEHVVPIESVQPMDRNPRKGDVAAIAASLDQFGQIKPIVVSLDGQIIAGNHTHAAAVTLGWTEIAAIRLPLKANETEALAIAIADNRTSDLSRWDNNQLADLLQTIEAADIELLAATGFTKEQVEELAGFVAPPAAPADDLEPDDIDPTPTVCPNCGYTLS